MEEKKTWAQQVKRIILENHHALIPQKVSAAADASSRVLRSMTSKWSVDPLVPLQAKDTLLSSRCELGWKRGLGCARIARGANVTHLPPPRSPQASLLPRQAQESSILFSRRLSAPAPAR